MIKIISIKDLKENKDLLKEIVGKACYTRGLDAMKTQNKPDSIIMGIDSFGCIETRYLRHLNFPTKFSHTYVIIKSEQE